jgi:outer membrane lipoprotein-sorting protein
MSDPIPSPTLDDGLPADWRDVADRIRSQTAPPESIERLTARLLSAPRPHRSSTTSSHTRRSRQWGVVCLAALAIVAAMFLLPVAPGPLAFADVQAQVRRTQSVQYVYLLTDDGVDKELNYMDAMRREIALVLNSVTEKQAQEFRALDERLKQRIEDFRKKKKAGGPIESRRVQTLGRYRHRSEWDTAKGKMISISNAETNQSITLYPDEKRCVLMKTQSTLNMKTGQEKVVPTKPDLSLNLYAEMAELPSKGVVTAGERIVDGKTLVGLHHVTDDDNGTWMRTYWVDPKSKLPEMIETTYRKRNSQISTWTRAKIIFDLPLDESLFNTTPPAGYKVEEGGFVSLEEGNKLPE